MEGEETERRTVYKSRRGRRARVGTAMQTPFGVSRSAQHPAMRVLTVCLDQAATDSPSSHNYNSISGCSWGTKSVPLYVLKLKQRGN